MVSVALIDGAVALPALEINMQYWMVAPGMDFGSVVPLTGSLITLLILVTLSVVCGAQKLIS